MARVELKVERIKQLINYGNGQDYSYKLMPISMLVEKLQSIGNVIELKSDWCEDYKITIKGKYKKQDFINKILNIFNDNAITKYFRITNLE